MLHPVRRLAVPKALAILLIAMLMLPVYPASAQSLAEDEAVEPIALTLANPKITDEGRSWFDASGLHIRDLARTFIVDGDLVGQAMATTDLDWSGACNQDALTCDGGQESFSQIEVASEGSTWTGTLALETAPDEQSEAHGVLIGRHGTDDQVIIISELTSTNGDGFQLSGMLVTLTGPIGGVNLTGSACLTGPTTADGGFLGTGGLVEDSGPLRVRRHAVGGVEPFGIYGDTHHIGHKGELRGFFSATMNSGHAHGSFVLIGESGPYRGMLGYGRATATVSPEPRCQSGLQISSTWTGQVRYLTDPATFLAPRVFFSSPAHEARVENPVMLELVAEHVDVAPADEAGEGSGHFTVIVDAPCVGPGEPMPRDDQHIQLVEGETSLEISLLTGEHRLCLQLTDSAGIAQPATDVISIFVVPSGGGDPGNF